MVLRCLPSFIDVALFRLISAGQKLHYNGILAGSHSALGHWLVIRDSSRTNGRQLSLCLLPPHEMLSAFSFIFFARSEPKSRLKKAQARRPTQINLSRFVPRPQC